MAGTNVKIHSLKLLSKSSISFVRHSLLLDGEIKWKDRGLLAIFQVLSGINDQAHTHTHTHTHTHLLRNM